jgi:hypothetical protein
MNPWPALDPTQQNELLGEMTTLIVEQQPPGWREVMIDFNQLGNLIDVAVGVLDPNGTHQVWDPPAEVWRMFQRLRGGMYREGEGTWFGARIKIEPPARFTLRYNWREKPSFPNWPTPDQFAVDLERFARGEAYMPSWFRESLGT